MKYMYSNIKKKITKKSDKFNTLYGIYFLRRQWTITKLIILISLYTSIEIESKV